MLPPWGTKSIWTFFILSFSHFLMFSLYLLQHFGFWQIRLDSFKLVLYTYNLKSQATKSIWTWLPNRISFLPGNVYLLKTLPTNQALEHSENSVDMCSSQVTESVSSSSSSFVLLLQQFRFQKIRPPKVFGQLFIFVFPYFYSNT